MLRPAREIRGPLGASRSRCNIMSECVEKCVPSVPSECVRIMAEGGDGRIVLDPATGLNRYHSKPAPSDVLAYASSTANDISPGAFAHVQRCSRALTVTPAKAGVQSKAEVWIPAFAGMTTWWRAAPMPTALEALRGRIRAAYDLADDVAIVFAPSGTDLEYVALACVAGRAPGGTHNILLGADEVGSGCIHSAHGRYFAETTALGVATTKGEPVAGLDLRRLGRRSMSTWSTFRSATARARCAGRPRSRRGWRRRSSPPRPPAATSSSMSSTARRPG